MTKPKHQRPVIRDAYSPRISVPAPHAEEESRTHQSFKDQCDINNIVRRHAAGEITTHINQKTPQYVDVTPLDFREAMSLVAQVRQEFDGLPATERSDYGNDPENYLRARTLAALESLNGDEPETPEAREASISATSGAEPAENNETPADDV